jgi:hypothetical protein
MDRTNGGRDARTEKEVAQSCRKIPPECLPPRAYFMTLQEDGILDAQEENGHNNSISLEKSNVSVFKALQSSELLAYLVLSALQKYSVAASVNIFHTDSRHSSPFNWPLAMWKQFLESFMYFYL